MNFRYDGTYAYGSRRSVVLSPAAAVASSQPLATEAGLHILRSGGSAADAAIAVAAALQVTQACSTGLGGDAFCLYYEAASDRVYAYNGSGRSPRALTREAGARAAAEAGTPNAQTLPSLHVHTVTVPGAADAWTEVHRRFGRLAFERVVEPAIRLAADGCSLEPMTARWWAAGIEKQVAYRRYGHELMVGDRAPRVGERFRNPGLAAVLEALAGGGRGVFYDGWIAQRIVEEIRHEGGCMTLDDLSAHRGDWTDPISIRYGDYDVWECPPNGQGLAALLALHIYRHVPERIRSDRAGRLHAQVEAMRLAFADAARCVADPRFAPAPLDRLLDPRYASERAGLIGSERLPSAGPGLPPTVVGSDTVYFSVVDAEGNGCSFINSNFAGFGTGIVPRGCGFTLQNRGHGFVLERGHANELAPGKRPYHTIIPGLLTRGTGGLAAVFGVMGGMMQPQGHLQVVARLVDDQTDPQTALDAPRFQLSDGAPDGRLLIEASEDRAVIDDLRRRGHDVEVIEDERRSVFGLGQVIARGAEGILWSGSDPRGDGHAGGF